jgi:hypothetical protein
LAHFTGAGVTSSRLQAFQVANTVSNTFHTSLVGAKRQTGHAVGSQQRLAGIGKLSWVTQGAYNTGMIYVLEVTVE